MRNILVDVSKDCLPFVALSGRPGPSQLDDRYLATAGTVHMSGIHALARLPLDVRRADRLNAHDSAVFISGYEGSPLGGYDLELGRHKDLLDSHDIVFRPAVNEELAATAVQGTQLAATLEDRRVTGITGFWYGKSPGLDRASDALRHANLGGTHHAGGAVALVGDDPAAKSSTVPGASEFLLADLGMPILYPASPQEVLDFGLHAVAMSRSSGLWTALKIVTDVADGAGFVRLDPGRLSVSIPDTQINGIPFRHSVTAMLLGPALTTLEGSRNGPRLEIARRYIAANNINRIVRSGDDDRIGIVAAGKSFVDLRQGLRLLGLNEHELARHGIRLLHLGAIHPLDPDIVREFAAGLADVIVVEEKRPFVESRLKEVLYGRAEAPAVHGKRGPGGEELLPEQGELDADAIAVSLSTWLLAHGEFPSVQQWLTNRRTRRPRVELALATRTPYFCSGCPHNTSTMAPDGSLVGAGIGCHSLAAMMRPELVGNIAGFTQMGGEGAQWIGIAPFVDRSHMLQNIGDGTFHHSGSLAVRAATAAGINITYKLLYNSAVAMTGGQQAVGQLTVPELIHSLLAEGVAQIIVTTDDPKAYRRRRLPRGVRVWHRDRIIEAQEKLAATPGVTVLIHDQECATELRRKRKRGLAADPDERVFINERVCEGCGDCGVKSNCLSVQPVATEFGRKTVIDQSSCNKDFSCLKGDCPSFLTVVPAASRKRHAAADSIDADDLPDPPAPSFGPNGRHTTRILGVGGSGVVTLSQILGVAAKNAGLFVVSLDQTGLAQKGGAVLSDIKISPDDLDDTANKAAEGEVDLYLGADLLVAADPSHLRSANTSSTVAVVSTAEIATGTMVADPAVTFPPVAELTARISAAVRADRLVLFDARALSRSLFGDDQYANLLLAGAAYQAGALPVPADAIEAAVRLNGVKVTANLEAFRRGRQLVANPASLWSAVGRRRPAARRGAASPPRQAAALAARVASEPGSELDRLLSVRIADLIAYQNVRYAAIYVDFVAQVRHFEETQTPGMHALSEAVAKHLYKLMAYKDEYEVARLSISPDIEAEIASAFGHGAKVSYRLHPPLLRALGLQSKIRLGRWFRPAFRTLVALRHLRGHWIDPFGHTRVRRTERGLVSEYRELIEGLLPHLTRANSRQLVRIAELPDQIRGYEEIKMANVAAYRRDVADLRAELERSDPILTPSSKEHE